jgi:hypothetical protein
MIGAPASITLLNLTGAAPTGERALSRLEEERIPILGKFGLAALKRKTSSGTSRTSVVKRTFATLVASKTGPGVPE